MLKSLTTERKKPQQTQEIRGLSESPIVVRSAGSLSGERSSEILDPTPTNGQLSYSFTTAGVPEHAASLLHYWRVLRKRKWTVLATLVVIWALSAIATLRETRLYEAVSELAIFPENSNVLGLKDGEGPSVEDWDYSVALETQTAILRSDSLALKVIQAMHLSQDPRFVGEAASHPDPSRDLSAMQLSDGETH